MSNWVIPNEGKILALQRWLFTSGVSAAENYLLQGFQSNTTVGDASTLSDFTISTFTGYSDVAIAHTDFPAPTITSNEALSTAPDALFACSSGSGQNMYGVLLVGVTSGKIIAGLNFAAVRSMGGGATETVTPTIRFKTY